MHLTPDINRYDVCGVANDLAAKATIDRFDRYLLAPGQPNRAVREQIKLPQKPERGSCSAAFVRTPGSMRGSGPGAGYRGPPR